MPFQVSPIPKSAAAEQMHLMYAAYQDDIVSKLFYDIPAPPEVIQGSIDGLLANWDGDPTERRMQVTDSETGKMIGFLVLFLVPRRDGEEWKTPPIVGDRLGWHGDAFKTIIRDKYMKRVELMGAQPYIYLETLVTSPNHRRRGAASLLMQWVIDQGRALNLPVYLHASPDGLPLYQKYGFKEVDKMEVDVSSVSTVRRFNICMIWDPRDLENDKKVDM